MTIRSEVKDWAAHGLPGTYWSPTTFGGGIAPVLVNAPILGKTGTKFVQVETNNTNRSEIEATSSYWFTRYETMVTVFERAWSALYTGTTWNVQEQWKDLGSQSTSPPIQIEQVSSGLRYRGTHRGSAPMWTKTVLSSLPTNQWLTFCTIAYLDGPAGSPGTRSAGWVRCLQLINGVWTEIVPQSFPENGTWYTDGGQSSSRPQHGIYTGASFAAKSWIGYLATGTSLADFGIVVGGSGGGGGTIAAPTAAIVSTTASPVVNSPVSFDMSGSHGNTTGQAITSYALTFDGTTTTSTGAIQSRTPTTSGTKTATVVVTQTDGQTATASTSVTVAPVATPLTAISGLVDDFSSGPDTTRWPTQTGAPTTSNGALVLAPSSSAAIVSIKSAKTYEAAGDTLTIGPIVAVDRSAGVGQVETRLTLIVTDSTTPVPTAGAVIKLVKSDVDTAGTINFIQTFNNTDDNGTPVTAAWDATAMAWWRFRLSADGATLFFETSPDGTTWTTQRTGAPTWKATSSQSVAAGVFGRIVTGTPTVVAGSVGGVNTAPTVTPPPPPPANLTIQKAELWVWAGAGTATTLEVQARVLTGPYTTLGAVSSPTYPSLGWNSYDVTSLLNSQSDLDGFRMRVNSQGGSSVSTATFAHVAMAFLKLTGTDASVLRMRPDGDVSNSGFVTSPANTTLFGRLNDPLDETATAGSGNGVVETQNAGASFEVDFQTTPISTLIAAARATAAGTFVAPVVRALVAREPGLLVGGGLQLAPGTLYVVSGTIPIGMAVSGIRLTPTVGSTGLTDLWACLIDAVNKVKFADTDDRHTDVAAGAVTLNFYEPGSTWADPLRANPVYIGVCCVAATPITLPFAPANLTGGTANTGLTTPGSLINGTVIGGIAAAPPIFAEIV